MSAAVAEILIVDDQPQNLQLLANILSREGYRMRPAPSGTTALRSAAAKAPDLVLLDVHMPGMDGYEVCRRLKAEAGTRDVPVIFLSAASDEESVVEGFAAGGVDYIAKPIRSEEVIARVRTQMELSMLRQRLEQRVAERTEALANANRALRESEERLAQVFEATRDGVWDWDMASGGLFLSDRWYGMLGYTPGESRPVLAAALGRLADNYDYQTILDALECAPERTR
ncbi:MAG: response regulator [Candidatus Competibacter sp.]|nr:response regulator [Candidatus Competibacter sp.]HRD49005.1 response regulator [Candidatus Contendobacter sp.]